MINKGQTSIVQANTPAALLQASSLIGPVNLSDLTDMCNAFELLALNYLLFRDADSGRTGVSRSGGSVMSTAVQVVLIETPETIHFSNLLSHAVIPEVIIATLRRIEGRVEKAFEMRLFDVTVAGVSSGERVSDVHRHFEYLRSSAQGHEGVNEMRSAFAGGHNVFPDHQGQRRIDGVRIKRVDLVANQFDVIYNARSIDGMASGRTATSFDMRTGVQA